jgi:thiol:disulfide interchange protein
MNKLTYNELDDMFKDGQNLTDKPIFIDFYATW